MVYRLIVHTLAPENEEEALERLKEALAEEGIEQYGLYAHALEGENSERKWLHLEFSIDALSSWDAREVSGLDLVTRLLQEAEIPFTRQGVQTVATREPDAALQ
jgi:hypothetical protein